MPPAPAPDNKVQTCFGEATVLKVDPDGSLQIRTAFGATVYAKASRNIGIEDFKAAAGPAEAGSAAGEER